MSETKTLLNLALELAQQHLEQIASQEKLSPTDAGVIEKYGKLALMAGRADSSSADPLDEMSDEQLRQLALGETNDSSEDEGV